MKLAIQADMLPARSASERYQMAQDLGFDGIELWAQGLDDRLLEVAGALNTLNLEVASVHLGAMDGYLSPNIEMREAAISKMRQAMATAVDLQCANVVFVPHWGTLATPDLTPHRSAEEISSDLMIWLLRTVSDLAYALGTTLHMQPRHRYHTAFMNTVPQAVKFSDAIKDNPHVRIAPNLFDMALEEADVIDSLVTHGKRMGYLYLADSNGRLPGQGVYDWAKIADAIRSSGYDGWLCLSAGKAITNPKEQYRIYDGLADSLTLLRDVGLISS
ncbi:MAG: sugar phosphate isomerase/epimerase family protein [Phototrophicaceae bacterium]